MGNVERVFGVYEIRGKKSLAEPGMYGYDAEARVEDQFGDGVFVHVNAYDMFRHYTVAKESIFDGMTGDGDMVETEFIEEYEKMTDAKNSMYAKVFDTLNKVITRMEKGLA